MSSLCYKNVDFEHTNAAIVAVGRDCRHLCSAALLTWIRFPSGPSAAGDQVFSDTNVGSQQQPSRS